MGHVKLGVNYNPSTFFSAKLVGLLPVSSARETVEHERRSHWRDLKIGFVGAGVYLRVPHETISGAMGTGVGLLFPVGYAEQSPSGDCVDVRCTLRDLENPWGRIVFSPYLHLTVSKKIIGPLWLRFEGMVGLAAEELAGWGQPFGALTAGAECRLY
jgi:hypothetical protein